MEETNKEECSELVLTEQKRGRGRPPGTFKKTVDNSGFLKAGGHEFKDIVKKTRNDMVAVMERLAKIATDEVGKISDVMKAAELFTTNYTKMVDQMNKDEIVRKEKEITVRKSAGSGSLEDDDEEDEDNAELDFNNISEEFREVPVIEQTIVDNKE